MTDKYCPLRFREYGSNQIDQECIGSSCAWFDKCSQSAQEPRCSTADNQTGVCTENGTVKPQEPREAAENECSQDSREKLEADVLEAGCDGEIDYDRIIEWLDRQAAITERECGNEIENLRMMLEDTLESNDELRAKVDTMTALAEEYGEKVDELTVERDYWKLQTDCWADKHAELEKRITDYAHMLDEALAKPDCNCCEWSEELDELKAENAKLSSDELHWHSEADYWKRQYELICRAVEDVARNYCVDEGLA